MGVKYAREYDDIVQDLTEGLLAIDNFYEFFDMSMDVWNSISGEEQFECARTLADDIFYGLGNEAEIIVGSGMVKYSRQENSISIYNKEICIKTISLI